MTEASARAMSTDVASDSARAWTVVGMLCLFMLINFADRAVLGLAAIPIMQDLGLSHTEFGLIAASFYTFFSLSAVIGGILVNRVATTWVLAGLALIWSLCQLPMLLPVTSVRIVSIGYRCFISVTNASNACSATGSVQLFLGASGATMSAPNGRRAGP